MENALTEKLAQFSQLLLNSENAQLYAQRLLDLYEAGTTNCQELLAAGFLPSLLTISSQQASAQKLLNYLAKYLETESREFALARLVKTSVEFDAAFTEGHLPTLTQSLQLLTVFSVDPAHAQVLRSLGFVPRCLQKYRKIEPKISQFNSETLFFSLLYDRFPGF
jgi:hypothetical protein